MLYHYIQPRIRLMRSFDERSNSYLGFNLRIYGQTAHHDAMNVKADFTVGIGNGAQKKHQFRVGDKIEGKVEPVINPEMETAEYYKVAKLKRTDPSGVAINEPPPYQGVPPELTVYRERGHRRLAARTY